MFNGKKKGQWQALAAFELLSNPAIFLTIAFAIFLITFGGLGWLNGITQIFGIDILQGALSGILRPAAAIIAIYIVYLLILMVSKAALNKDFRIKPLPLGILLIGLVLAGNFAWTGQLFAAGVPTEPALAGQTIDITSLLFGLAIGAITIFITYPTIYKKVK